MQKITHFAPDDWVLWIRLENKGRYCYYGIADEDLPNHNAYHYECALEDKPLYNEIMEIIEADGFDVSIIPHIEKTSPALQYMWQSMLHSESNMFFVETDTPSAWENLQLSREEFERQVDNDIRTYHLQNFITKNEDGRLYTCYGDLQSRFSGEVEKIEDKIIYGNQQAGFLNLQAKKALLNLYGTSNDSQRDFLWNVLKCIGCEKEFAEYFLWPILSTESE